MTTLNALWAKDDRLKEISKLRAEIERLKSDYEIQMRKVDIAEAESERLRAALHEIAHRGHDDCALGPKSCIRWAQVTAMRALEQSANKTEG